jgi:hypothetical protein
MSFITPYITTSNVLYTSTALWIAATCSGFGKKPELISKLQKTSTALTLFGMGAVIVKEKAALFPLTAIISSIAFSHFLAKSTRKTRKSSPEENVYTIGFNAGIAICALGCLIKAIGTKISHAINA